tara:strand:- start:627 stop:1124 length:498 start_codon:yes stop_codon:yes gene_type:complete
MNSKNLYTTPSSSSTTLFLAVFFSTLISLLASFATIAAEDEAVSISASTQWINELGSVLTITTIDSTGLLTGNYVNKAAGYPCKDTAYPVTGWVDGTAIIFNTLWINSTESCNSITAWTGFYYNNQISTLWQLVEDGATAVSQISSGSDTFTQKTNIAVTAKVQK